MKKGELYRLDFSDGKSYIGATVKKARIRFLLHRHEVVTGNCSPLYTAWRQQGEPRLTVLQKEVESDKLLALEAKAISLYNTVVPYGYNVRLTGTTGMLGKKHSKESLKRISAGNLGKVLSEETRKRMSRAKLGVLNNMFGRTHSDDAKAKISRAHLGKKHSEESNDKNRLRNLGELNAMFGRHHSEETKAKIRASKAARRKLYA